MSRAQHLRLLQNAFYAGLRDRLNVNNSFADNLQAFSKILPYYDADTRTSPECLTGGAWEDMWHYLSDRSYGLQYKTLVLNAHYADALKHMHPNDVLKGDWEALREASGLPEAPCFFAD